MPYNPALDCIRAIAVLAVLAYHARVPSLPGGFLGVDAFFVLSGYLITRLLWQEALETGTIGIRAFYVRRMRRLYPALIGMVATYLLLAPLAFPETTNRGREALIALTYMADYGHAIWRLPGVLLHSWSLAVEEKFYLLWPLAVIALMRLPKRQAGMLLLLTYLACTAWRIAIFDADGWVMAYYRSDTRASGLVLGALMAILRPRFSPLAAIAAVFGLGLLFCTAHPRHPYSLGPWMLAAEGCTAVMIGAATENARLPGASWLAWIGRMSYGIYLWHYPIVYWMRHHHAHWLLTLLLGGSTSIALGALSFYLIERRFRHGVRRYTASVVSRT